MKYNGVSWSGMALFMVFAIMIGVQVRMQFYGLAAFAGVVVVWLAVNEICNAIQDASKACAPKE